MSALNVGTSGRENLRNVAILIRRDTGFPWGDGSGKGDIFLDSGHAFRDYTDAPAPSITTRPIEFVVTKDERPMLATEKPPYRVPSMAEIAAVPDTGLRVVSTFSGCGGSCLGFEMAGYRVLWANEFIAAAREVYAANHPNVILDPRSIREIAGRSILDAIGLGVGDVDVLEGSPPCASFSTAGKREKHWGKVKKYSDGAERADDLFFEFVRIVGETKPKVFVAENVSGLVKGKAKGYFKLILAAMKAAGYRVEARLLDAQWLGVPQMRQRIIFVGVRNDLDRDPVFPSPLPYRYSVRDAIPWIGGITVDQQTSSHGDGVWPFDVQKPLQTVTACVVGSDVRGDWLVDCDTDNSVHEDARRFYRDQRGAFGNGGEISDKPSPTVLADSVADHDTDISRYAIGAEWDKLGPGGQSEKYFSLVRSDPEKPVQTITASGGEPSIASVTHPTERRKFTIAELRRICGFPDDFILTGTYAQQWERLGRAVPPPMMEKVAIAIREGIFDR